MNSEVPDILPDYITFNDPERSWELFILLEAFSDGMGAWKYLPINAHLLDQIETEIDDLLQWKYLTEIIEKQNRRKEIENKDEDANSW